MFYIFILSYRKFSLKENNSLALCPHVWFQRSGTFLLQCIRLPLLDGRFFFSTETRNSYLLISVLAETQWTFYIGKCMPGMEKRSPHHGPWSSLGSFSLTLSLSPIHMADPKSYMLSPGTNCRRPVLSLKC